MGWTMGGSIRQWGPNWRCTYQLYRVFVRLEARSSRWCSETLSGAADQLIGGVSRSAGRSCWAKSNGASKGRIARSLGQSKGLEQRFTNAAASSQSLASQRRTPATNGLASLQGPAGTVRLAPRSSPRLEDVVGCRPLLAFGIPALINACHPLRKQTAQPPTTRASTIS